MSDKPRVVFDCNTLVQAVGSPNGPAGRSVQLALEGRVILVISPVILAELREATARPRLIQKLKLRAERTEAYLASLQRAGWILQGFAETFVYARDPDDAHYINLAVASDTKLIVSRDNDLLELMDRSKPESAQFQEQFPMLRILDPVSFLKEIAPRGS
jgi:putative PIN family toxin of toxin-antitoxin system